jgi:hypothetical protein
VYIGGSGRSGTTILRRVLTLKGKAICFNEPKFMIAKDGFRDLLQGRISPGKYCRAMLLTHAARIEETTGIDRDVLSAILTEAAQGAADSLAFCRRFIDLYHAALIRLHPGLTLVEKEPHALEMASFLGERSPRIRFIHIYRDPRDVCCSVVASHWGPKSVSDFLDWYQQSMLDILRAQKLVRNSPYAVVSLERLCAEPVDCLQRLFSFMGIDPDPGELETAATSIDPGKSHMGRYKTELDPAQADFVMQACAPIHDELKRREKAWLHKACPELQLP